PPAARRRYPPPGRSPATPCGPPAPFAASGSTAPRPAPPRGVRGPASAKERTTLGSSRVAVTSRCSASSCRVRQESNPNASATTAAAAAMKRLQTTRRAARTVDGGASFLADCARAAAASRIRARRSAGGSPGGGYGSRSKAWRTRGTSAASSASVRMRRSSAWASSRRSSPSTYSTRRSSETSTGPLMASSREVLERSLERHQGAARSALHRPERRVEIGGDLRLAETLVVRQLEHLPLGLRKLRQRATDPLRALRRRQPLEGAGGRGGGRCRLVPGLEQPYRTSPTAQAVERSRSRHRRQECAHGAAGGIVCRRSGHRQEDLLREILRL